MKLTTKILIALGVILTLGLLSVIVYQQYQLKHQQDAIETQVVLQKTLSDQLVRAQSQYATNKDIDNFIKNNGLSLKDIQNDLDKLHGDITSVNQVVVKSNGTIANNLPSSSVGAKNPVSLPPAICKDGTPCPNTDVYNYQQKQQNLALTEPFGNTQVPIGTVGFSAWQEKPWNLNILPRQYSITSVVGTDENQRQYFYNKVRINVDGKNYDIQIAKADTQQVVPEAKFSWINFRLFMGMDAGLDISSLHGDFVPNIDLQVASYGRFLNQPTFSILQLGIGYGIENKQAEFILTPFAYNIGENLPLVNNIYLGPSLMVAPNGDFSVMAGIRVGL